MFFIIFSARSHFQNYITQVENDLKCKYQNADSVVLNLSPCDRTSFTCDDGICIGMEKRCLNLPNIVPSEMIYRCDQAVDCPDLSDEKNCKTVVFDTENYIMGKPPKKALVKVKIELLNVLEISEIGMLFKSQFKLYLEWFDARLKFHNLHEGKVANRIVDKEKNEIWIPQLIFENTDLKLRTKRDTEAVVYVNRTGTYKVSGIEHLDNEYIFNGAENAIEISRIYNIDW